MARTRWPRRSTGWIRRAGCSRPSTLGLAALSGARPDPQVRKSPPSRGAALAGSVYQRLRCRPGPGGRAAGRRSGRPAPSPGPCRPERCGRRSRRVGSPPAGSAAQTPPSPPPAPGSRASCRGAPGAGGRSRPRTAPLAVVRLLEAMVLLAFGQHLRGRHPSDQNLTGLADPRSPGLLGVIDHLQLGVQKAKPPRRPLPPHSAVGQLAGQLGGPPAASPPPDQTQATQPSAELSFASH